MIDTYFKEFFSQTKIENLFVAGDGAGVSRGIVGTIVTGIIAAKV